MLATLRVTSTTCVTMTPVYKNVCSIWAGIPITSFLELAKHHLYSCIKILYYQYRCTKLHNGGWVNARSFCYVCSLWPAAFPTQVICSNNITGWRLLANLKYFALHLSQN
jgi:hypothetical protein